MKFAEWLNERARETGWSLREIGRRADISAGSMAKYAVGDVIPGPESCLKLAEALGVPYQDVMRLAGHLPSETRLPVIDITDAQLRAINLVRELEGKGPVIKVDLDGYVGVNLGEEIEKFLQEFPELRRIMEFAKAYRLSDEHLRAMMRNIKVFLENPEMQIAFAQAHGELSEVFRQRAQVVDKARE